VLLLLLLGALLVLARTDGATWVQPWYVTLFDALAIPPARLLAAGLLYLLCVRKHCSVVLQNKGFSLPARRPLHHCFLRLSLSQFHFCLQQLGSVGYQLLLLLLLKCCFLLSCRCGKSCMPPAENSPLEQSVLLLLGLLLGQGGGQGGGVEEAGGPFVARDAATQ
jgi:hypothetical protein